MKEKTDLAILEVFFSVLFFSFSSAVTRAFPSPIKREAVRPMKGDLDPHEIEPRDKKYKSTIRAHAEQRSSSQHPFTCFTRDLGSFSSLACL